MVAIIILVLLLLFIWFLYDIFVFKMPTKQRFYPVRSGKPTLFADGPALFDDFFTVIENASEEIYIFFYIVKRDQISEQFMNTLAKKAGQGVEVKLLLDWFGCRMIKRKLVKKIKEHGGEVRFSRIPKFPHIFQTINTRNHQKIAVIDGQTSYIGGFNVGKEYINKKAELAPWRDYHLKLEGEIGTDFRREFLDMWHNKLTQFSNKSMNPLDVVKMAAPPINRFNTEMSQAAQMADRVPSTMQLLPYQSDAMEKQYLAYIGRAEKRILIGSAYFIPTKNILQALVNALDRGVTLEIIFPERSDHILVHDAAVPAMRQLIPLGATFYLYQNGFYHAKFIAIDDKLVEVGTANFNIRSFITNDEISCRLTDPVDIANIYKQIEADINDSRLLTIADISRLNFLQKTKVNLVKLLAPFL